MGKKDVESILLRHTLMINIVLLLWIVRVYYLLGGNEYKWTKRDEKWDRGNGAIKYGEWGESEV